MTFSDYKAFRVALQWLIEGDELTGTFSVNVLDLIIGLGEARVYQGDSLTPGLRASTMLATATLPITANAATLPATLLELKEVYFAGKKPVEIVPLERLREYETYGGGGDARYAAQDGDKLRFFPEASGNVEVSYYAKPADLETGGLHSTFNRYPELYLFASLVEAASFVGLPKRLAEWEAKYRQLASGALHSERMRVYGGSRLRQRAR